MTSRGRAAVLVLLVAIGGVVASVVALRDADDAPETPALNVGWGGSEGHPSCVYDKQAGTVTANLVLEGRAPHSGTVTVTVTAYADENTSQQVGSGSHRERVEGAVNRSVRVTFSVAGPPYVDIDGETACSMEVAY